MWLWQSWSRLKDIVAIVLTLILCVFLIDYFLFSVLPSALRRQDGAPSPPLFEFGTPEFQDIYEAVIGSGNHHSTGGEERGSVRYRNASWKSDIGRFLSRCNTAVPLVSIPERFRNLSCHRECSGRGVCNYDLAECRCFHGYGGKGCELGVEFPCTVAESIWRVSRCGAFCDKTRAFCYCGEGTKYPRRPVAESCGFIVENGFVKWNLQDPSIFTEGNSGEHGWCNLVPSNLTMQRKEHCHCTYDGTGGIFCDEHVQGMCINQCSGNGDCRGGFCACAEGWHGIDCSVPSSLQSLDFKNLPGWIPPSTLDSAASNQWEKQTFFLNVKRPKPLIYVYDLPSKFNSHLAEGRHFRLWCAIRQYDNQNMTIWTDNLYGSEPALLESILASSHRTTNAEEADYFYVPAFEACARVQADSAPHTDMQKEFLGQRAYFSGALQKEAYEHVKEYYPYWNRSGGRDHIWLFPWDEGACSAPKEIWNSIMLVHWGNTNAKHNYSTTAYSADSWTDIPSEWRGNHPCYDPSKDIVLPAWKKPDPHSVRRKLATRTRGRRKTLFYFNGNLGSMYDGGRPEPHYSMGLRQKLAQEFGSLPNKEGKIGRQAAPDVMVVNRKSSEYELELSRSRFCGVLPGDGWSGRIEDSILHGCIPVIIQDGVHLPYENVLEYSSFAVRIAEKDIPDMVQILRSINQSQVDFMLLEVQGIWQRFTYHSTVKLEAKRQRFLRKREVLWASVYNKLVEDDVFATLMQVLHFKLSNRVWGRNSISLAPTPSSTVKDHCEQSL